jgi:SAM-dependent methyltransferase
MPSALELRGPILPPFDFNCPNVSKHSPEVTGRIIIKSMCQRLAWPSLAGKRILDFGCGVRMVRTIFNLEMEVDLYTGVDVNAAAIAWLKENVDDPRFRFAHLDMQNAQYNPTGNSCTPYTLCDMGFDEFDLACMFSVITHQEPNDAELIFRMLRPCAERLYFTTFIDDAVDDFLEKSQNPSRPRDFSCYSTEFMRAIVLRAGWSIDAVHPHARSLFQQTTFVCRRHPS